MVGGDVGNDGDFRMKHLAQFQLIAGDFRHHHTVFAHLVHTAYQRCADIAPYTNGNLRAFHHLSRQRRGRGFSVGARNGNNRRFAQRVRKFDFRHYGDVIFFGTLDNGIGRWHRRAGNEQIRLSDDFFIDFCSHQQYQIGCSNIFFTLSCIRNAFLYRLIICKKYFFCIVFQ